MWLASSGSALPPGEYLGKLKHPTDQPQQYSYAITAGAGGRVAVGAPHTVVNGQTDAGAVYTYRLPNLEVQDTCADPASTPFSRLGAAAAWSGNIVNGGAPQDGNTQDFSARSGGRVLQFANGSSTGYLPAPVSGFLSRFGEQLSACGKHQLIVLGNSTSDVYLFDRNSQLVKTIPSANRVFSITGNRHAFAIATSHLDQVNVVDQPGIIRFYSPGTGQEIGSEQGRHIVAAGEGWLIRDFATSASGASIFTLSRRGVKTMLVPPADTTFSQYDTSLAASSEWIALGNAAESRVDVYKVGQAAAVATYTHPEPHDFSNFGRTLAICGKYLVVGDMSAPENGVSNVGNAYVFNLP
jgi:hypothetical protein